MKTILDVAKWISWTAELIWFLSTEGILFYLAIGEFPPEYLLIANGVTLAMPAAGLKILLERRAKEVRKELGVE